MDRREDQREPGWEGPLPEQVRLRVLDHAGATLGALGDDEVPAALRAYRSWAPARRTRLAATPLAAALERDAHFRARTFARARTVLPDLAEALVAGAPPPAADPVDVAAVAYLGRTPGWAALVGAAGADQDRASEVRRATAAAAQVAGLEAELAAAHARSHREAAALRAELDAARAESGAATRALREERGARRRAERAAAAAEESSARAGSEAAAAVREAAAVEREARLSRAEAESALLAARKAGRDGRNLADTRLRLLLDTVVEAASGLRRELALPPAGERPADLVDASRPGDDGTGDPGPAPGPDDPARLDQLLGLPQVHLVVDGYNVTKTGFPELSLEDQRSRLVRGLAAVAARSGAEVTCCFDGADLPGRVPGPGARGVRVLFSRPGETADELIRRLVAAEPAGRPVVVVSSDREVAEDARRAGARPVAAAALVRRLDRG